MLRITNSRSRIVPPFHAGLLHTSGEDACTLAAVSAHENGRHATAPFSPYSVLRSAPKIALFYEQR